jgi:UDP-glucose:O-linked fucose beta-1,3-glucosyltransferase
LLRKTLFAVKTCQLFHNSRLQIVRETWGKVAENIIYVSDVENSELQTVVLPGAEENTSRGHCRKSQSILKHFRANYKEKGWKWLVVTDDDTMLSVSKLMDLLTCYDPDEKVALGERYGHKVSGIRGRLGFDYLAGGAGMVFSYSTVTSYT